MEHKMFIIILPKFYPQAYLALSDVQITDVWDVHATTPCSKKKPSPQNFGWQ